ncbi:MAG: ADP-forming succinate--CoA ligase subunit beta [Chloroflexota bacterium]|nr:ADP-forming succinate--CoA ligase subunit beta [Chloroflexota bacterium]
MRLHEYQSKEIFNKFNIPIPKGHLASTPEEAKRISEELNGPVVLKAQVLIGGRGKAGGIRLVKSPNEAEEEASNILGKRIKEIPVRRLLIEEAVAFNQEIYIGMTVDREKGDILLIASAEGGVDIEEVARSTPERIAKISVNPLLGLRAYQARNLAAEIGIPRQLWRSFISVLKNLYRAYLTLDATLAEINPLVITNENHLIALDGKIILDDSALFRHPELVDKRDISVETPEEIEARKFYLSYIKLSGNIGCLVNGAGLAMATMDIIKHQGGQPANFLDIGGGASAEKVAAALRIILSDSQVDTVLINIFGGITRCDEVANGIQKTLQEIKTDVPFVIRLVGTNEVEGRNILASADLETASTLREAAVKAVAKSKVETT